MPTSIDQVQEFLDEYDLRYGLEPEHDAVLIGFDIDPQATEFRAPDGKACVRLVIRVLEEGDFLTVFCPWGWNVQDCPHRPAVLEALVAIQCQFKMLRFDYDPSDGEIRPNIELPLEDADMTSRQLHRLIHGMLQGIERYDGVIRHAMRTGEVSFAGVKEDEPAGPPSPAVVRLQRLVEQAGGLEELERLACGCEIEEPVAMTAGGQSPQESISAAAANPPPQSTRPSLMSLWQRLIAGRGRSRR